MHNGTREKGWGLTLYLEEQVNADDAINQLHKVSSIPHYRSSAKHTQSKDGSHGKRHTPGD